MILIGSRAVGIYLPEYLDGRNTCDFDFIGYYSEFKELYERLQNQAGVKVFSFKYKDDKVELKFLKDGKFQVIEFSVIDDPKKDTLVDSDKEYYNLRTGFLVQFNSLYVKEFGFAISVEVALNLDVYTFKVSHKYKKDSPHFLKTLNDIAYLKAQGCYVPKELEAFLARRERITYTNQLPKLNVKKTEFFTDSVPYKYDHDSIHRAVAMLDRPAYTYYMKDGQEVLCDKNKFFTLPEIVRLYGVLEECYTLALERAVIPHGTDPKRAFDISLMKVCTSITSGWFREYAYDNYHKVQALYHESYVDKFYKALDSGLILPYNSSSI